MRYGRKTSKMHQKKGFSPICGPKIKNKIQLQVTIPSAHPVQISSRSDYCITLSECGITKKKKRGLATTVQPKPDFSRTCGFRKMLGINEDCLNAKCHRNR